MLWFTDIWSIDLTLWTYKSVWIGTLATIEYVVVPKVVTLVSPLSVEQWTKKIPVFRSSVEFTNVVCLSSNQTITFQLADKHEGISWRTIMCKQSGGFCHSRMVTNVDLHGALFALGSERALISAACEVQARVIVIGLPNWQKFQLFCSAECYQQSEQSLHT